ncbi:unnamed protein product [Zymoseptoria tritici ST99CH_3D7]|uniref:Uncharacterized protein n=1 Tax=Zymoseptoria tritici (strain ST99CH_3D7) TaxID=1276538 RepID=A0A1X7RTW0_ZYMT9|nr:unnamed protein product [Zymoseptoria tritici ST99CH_3D7]
MFDSEMGIRPATAFSRPSRVTTGGTSESWSHANRRDTLRFDIWGKGFWGPFAPGRLLSKLKQAFAHDELGCSSNVN